MPTDAGILSKTQVENITAGSLVRTTIEQFAEALRGECKCIWHEHGGKFYSCDWCKRRKELLAAYDGKAVDTLTQ